jgi:hypothetical protein
MHGEGKVEGQEGQYCHTPPKVSVVDCFFAISVKGMIIADGPCSP